jgi:iron complex outermembrane recepter protein
MTRLWLARAWLLALPVGQAALAQSISPPEVLENPAALYPSPHNQAATVTLLVTVQPDGSVEEPVVVTSGGADFDAAAIAAVKLWKFRPALRDGVPYPARIRIPFVFQPPTAAAAPNAPKVGNVPGPPAGPVGPPGPLVVAPSAQASPSAAPPVVVPSPPASPANPADSQAAVNEVNVRGAPRPGSVGASDFQIEVGQMATLLGNTPEQLLELAPGIFIANEGGAGHADEVILRGFDSPQGQAIQFSVNGVPINQVDNPDGHGYADTHFIIPELVQSLHVIEGPFDPRQGDFAVAGSADYQLGVSNRMLLGEVQYGSFNTLRTLLLWAPPGERDGTFAGVQFTTTDGFGTNRAANSVSAMAQYEGELGTHGLWRLLGTAYATHYKSAGVVRADDVANGTVNFYGTEDPSQGGDAQHYSLSFQIIEPTNSGVLTQNAFVIYNGDRIQENFTGFLLDPVLQGQTAHPQRGDGILQQFSDVTAGLSGAYRLERNLFGFNQSLEVGYYARYDHTTPEIQRVKFGTQTPYQYDQNYITDIFNVAGYAALALQPIRQLKVLAGVRFEYFDYNVLNLCQLPLQYVPHSTQVNVICGTTDPEGGSRLADQRTTATALITEPKFTVFYELPADLTVTASYGVGASSLPQTNLTQDEQAPFSSIRAAEGGLIYHKIWPSFQASARALYFYTRVGQDQVFNPDLGVLSLATGTIRQGVVAATRLTGRWIDESASFTYSYATFVGTQTLVPYVPDIVARSDTVVFGKLPWRLADHAFTGSIGLGLNLIGVRALPLGQSASPTFVVNASATLRWSFVQLSVNLQNLLNSQYPSSEFFYASDFHHTAYPSLVPVEHFTAAPPFSVLFGLALILDKESDR